MAGLRKNCKHMMPRACVFPTRQCWVLALTVFISILSSSVAQLYINPYGFHGSRQASTWECVCPACPDAPSNTEDIDPSNSISPDERPPLNTYAAPAVGPPESPELSEIDERSKPRNSSIVCECNFRPIEVLYLLADKARGMNRSPKGFQDDLDTLASTPSASEADDMNKPVAPRRPGGRGRQPENSEDSAAETPDAENVPAPSNPTPAPADPAEKERQRNLARAYNVTPHCNGPDSVTPTRLKMMFPDKVNMGQRKDPSNKPSMVQVKTETPRSGQPQSPRIPANPSTSQAHGPKRPLAIPAFVTKPEFGGLIPQTGLPAETRKKIIAVHLATMPQDRRIPFPVTCIILKLRMEKSLVPDSKKAKFLKYNDVIDNNGQLKGDVKTWHDHAIDSAFLEMIPWQIFGLW